MPLDAPDRASVQMQVQEVMKNLTADQLAVAEAIIEHGVDQARKALGWSRWRYFTIRQELVAALRAAGCNDL